LILALSLLAGILAEKYARIAAQPLWLTGMLATIVGLVLVPILLCGLTFGLLVVFGMI
jgi:hypothetical protein